MKFRFMVTKDGRMDGMTDGWPERSMDKTIYLCFRRGWEERAGGGDNPKHRIWNTDVLISSTCVHFSANSPTWLYTYFIHITGLFVYQNMFLQGRAVRSWHQDMWQQMIDRHGICLLLARSSHSWKYQCMRTVCPAPCLRVKLLACFLSWKYIFHVTLYKTETPKRYGLLKATPVYIEVYSKFQ